MDFDLTTVLNVLTWLFVNKLFLGGAVGVFVGWNLPQPAIAKTIQAKIVAGLQYLWAKIRNNDETK